jgi:acyl-CoA synthetase (AMP-forming)/AMP-acid ligase II
MVPKKIVFMDSLPRTNNGKIDRKKLGEQLWAFFQILIFSFIYLFY